MSQPASKPMRIAIVVERFEPEVTSAERSTAQIAESLVARGHSVTVLCGSSVEEYAVEGIEVRSLARRQSASTARLLKFTRWARQRLAEDDYDVSLSRTTLVPAMIVQPVGGTIREALTRHVAMRQSPLSQWSKQLTYWLSPKHQALLALERKTLADPSVRRWVSISNYVSDQLQRHYDIDPDRIDLIPNFTAMPSSDLNTQQQWRTAIREGLGLEQDTTLFLFAARQPRVKGMPTLMRALRILADQEVEPVVMLAGGFGYAHQDWAAAVGLRSRLRFLGKCENMAALYAAADATVLPTFYASSSQVVLESLAMGTPAISTAYDGASDFITPKNGLTRGLVIDDSTDAPALADAMARLVEPEVRQRFTEATTGFAEQVSKAQHVDALERVLTDAADAGPPPSTMDIGQNSPPENEAIAEPKRSV